MSDIEVSATRLPGVGWRYEMALARGTALFVVVEDSGRRHLLLARDGEDEPLMTVPMDQAQSLALAALLSGARFTVVPQGPYELAGRPQTLVESYLVTPESGIVGLFPGDVAARLSSFAELLGVVCDQTPQILEGDPDRPVQVGDRIVVAARENHQDQVRAALDS